MDYEKKYKEALKRAKILYNDKNEIGYANAESVLEEIFPLLKESDDERISKLCKELIESAFMNELCNKEEIDTCIAWLEKQGEQRNKINSCKITFEDVLALECSMKTAKITEGGDKLYEILVPLYNKIYNAYLAEKQGEQKPDWSIKEKLMLNDIIETTERSNIFKENYQRELIDWLKSLKDKYTWKPSITQLNALSIVSKGNAPDDIEAIVSLYNDLKKLKG